MTSRLSSWFSTCLRFAVLVEGEGIVFYEDDVYLFESNVGNWSDAVPLAVALGKQKEAEYLNPDGARVRRRLKEVLTLDWLRVKDLDGAVVWSRTEPVPPEDATAFDLELQPDYSHPSSTGV